MTEEDIIDLGFEKKIVTDGESGNGYDYYYYSLEITSGIVLASIGHDEVCPCQDNHWFILNPDWPDIRIKNKKTVENLIKMSKEEKVKK